MVKKVGTNSLSNEDEKFLAAAEKEFGAMPMPMQKQFRKLDRKMALQKVVKLAGRHWKLWLLVALAVAVVVAIVIAVLAAEHRPNAASEATGIAPPSFPVSWHDQQAVPQAKLGPAGAEEPSETAEAFTATYVANLINTVIGPTVTVLRNQNVIVVARQDGQPGVAHVLLDKEGHFSTSCLLQAGGTLKRIGVEGGRQLVSYSPPTANAAVGAQWCTSQDLFYMRMG